MRYRIVLLATIVFLLVFVPRVLGRSATETGAQGASPGRGGPGPKEVEQAFFANFETAPAGLTSAGFSLNLGGDQFDFVFTTDGDGYGPEGFSHVTTFGEAGSGSMNLQSANINFETLERVLIGRNDGRDFIFGSVFVNNRGGATTTVTVYDNGVQVGSAQTVGSGVAATLNFGDAIVDEVELTSFNFADTNIDSFAGDTAIDLDYGDLPDSYGITSDADNGARHGIASVFLGDCVDADADGQASPTAAGDDADGAGQTNGSCVVANADEDGVVPSVPWQDGAGGGSLQATVSGGSGCLSGWVDWDGDDSLSEPGDQILDMAPVQSGANILSFDVPAGAFPASGATRSFYARFRLVSDSGTAGNCGDDPSLAVSGPAREGEVEDYLWSFSPTAVRMLGFGATAARKVAGAFNGALVVLSALTGAIVFHNFRRKRAATKQKD
jgi:hypothetical protein